jgi:hypothetical protein
MPTSSCSAAPSAISLADLIERPLRYREKVEEEFVRLCREDRITRQPDVTTHLDNFDSMDHPLRYGAG